MASCPGPSSSIGAVAVAPSDPNTLYVGTGEADIRANMIPGNGVYKSTDAGKTWQFGRFARRALDQRDPG